MMIGFKIIMNQMQDYSMMKLLKNKKMIALKMMDKIGMKIEQKLENISSKIFNIVIFDIFFIRIMYLALLKQIVLYIG